MRIVLLYILTMFITMSLSANDGDSIGMQYADTSTVEVHSKIYYPVNKVDIYENYMTNRKQLDYIKRHLAVSPRIDSITIHSFASPDGRYSFNKWLAEERGKTAKRYILSNIPEYRHFPDSLVKIAPIAENWAGMREEIEKNYQLADREEVLAIIDKPGVSDEERKKLLKGLNRGESWVYILKNIMPQLRYATWVSVWQPVGEVTPAPPVSQLPIGEHAFAPLELEPVTFPLIVPKIEYDTKTILALKSNLLYDALSWVNYSIEVPFCGDKFSALYYHQFPWWRWGEGNNKYCIRFLSIGGEGRWWFKPQPRPATETRRKRDCLVGHFVGAYCESGKYDFERRRDICYQGEFWSVGLSYGYSMPIGRYLNLEFSVSAGYASIAHRGYTPSSDYNILWRDYEKIGRWHYLGITKAQVSLVIPITIKVKKGGGL